MNRLPVLTLILAMIGSSTATTAIAQTTTPAGVARVTTSGLLDTSFSSDGKQTTTWADCEATTEDVGLFVQIGGTMPVIMGNLLCP